MYKANDCEKSKKKRFNKKGKKFKKSFKKDVYQKFKKSSIKCLKKVVSKKVQ